MSAIGRLAPTPSGRLHLGNALAFGLAWLSVRASSGRLLLRMEDVDRTRARADIEAQIRDDLRWLGLDWDEEVLPQRMRAYEPWLALIPEHTYFCACTRADLGGSARYPGTCRAAGHLRGALRFRLPDGPVRFTDRRFGPCEVDPATGFGDPVLRRRDGMYSYSLAVVVDDLVDGVTEVVRGADLLEYTAVQIPLWRALGATPPSYLHGPLLLGADGKKLSKSHGSTEIAALAAAGWTARDVWRKLLPFIGIEDVETLADAVSGFRADAGPRGPITLPEAAVTQRGPPDPR